MIKKIVKFINDEIERKKIKWKKKDDNILHWLEFVDLIHWTPDPDYVLCWV